MSSHTLTEKSTLQEAGRSAGANLHMVSRWLKRDPSVHTACCKRKYSFILIDCQKTRGGVKVYCLRKEYMSWFYSGATRTGTDPDLVVWDDGDLRGVALHDGGETDLQVHPDAAVSSLRDPRLLAPGNKVAVLVHIGHHFVHLLRRKPEHTVASRPPISTSFFWGVFYSISKFYFQYFFREINIEYRPFFLCQNICIFIF